MATMLTIQPTNPTAPPTLSGLGGCPHGGPCLCASGGGCGRGLRQGPAPESGFFFPLLIAGVITGAAIFLGSKSRDTTNGRSRNGLSKTSQPPIKDFWTFAGRHPFITAWATTSIAGSVFRD